MLCVGAAVTKDGKASIGAMLGSLAFIIVFLLLAELAGVIYTIYQTLTPRPQTCDVKMFLEAKDEFVSLDTLLDMVACKTNRLIAYLTNDI